MNGTAESIEHVHGPGDGVPKLPQLHGVLVLNKPSGPSSAKCLSAIKRMGQRKIGHAGTLDPMASGVLLVLLGHATKLSSHLMAGGTKRYVGTLRLGTVTDTWDRMGTTLEETPWTNVTAADVVADVAAWTGLVEQPVPPFSAAKHEGQPLYRLARQGRVTPEKTKTIEISRAEVLETALPLVRFRVVCSSGTYVRSLAHSLGMRLGCGAVLTELTREYSHPFGLEASCSLQDIQDDPTLLPRRLRPLSEALPEWPQVELAPGDARRVRNGMPVPCGGDASPSEQALLMEDGRPLALAQLRGDCWTVRRGLWH
ncbi:MAG: tRNA pseudouridine(55) synthase TruB [Desulfovibrio sp.]|jgi:tRNA pseudouridine55 synthase|nr:tRNA pseudouridine(55) synthase TruB [Desulfovibrio sp.]